MPADKSTQKHAQVHQVHQHYQGTLFSFVSEDVTLPNGSRTELAMVRHPGSTAVVPMFDDNTVLMERQYRHAVQDYLLEIPAGTMEPGELPLNCARRELEEETGYAAEEFIELSQVLILPAYSNEKIYLYLARDLALTRQNLDKDEIIEVVKYPISDTMKMIDDGKITDALTILSLQMTWLYFQNEIIAPL
ncbi:ADP-ribose pyrophosphatase (EC [Olavius sp. associated proteobacterium Delta 1]|nr:ADP-ribose pyrophosphatase (EC [Olavius sp. associated proteobacterium Delta 1]